MYVDDSYPLTRPNKPLLRMPNGSVVMEPFTYAHGPESKEVIIIRTRHTNGMVTKQVCLGVEIDKVVHILEDHQRRGGELIFEELQ